MVNGGGYDLESFMGVSGADSDRFRDTSELFGDCISEETSLSILTEKLTAKKVHLILARKKANCRVSLLLCGVFSELSVCTE